jgi:hypothetical protein
VIPSKPTPPGDKRLTNLLLIKDVKKIIKVFQLLEQIIILPLFFLTLSFLFSHLSHFVPGLHKKGMQPQIYCINPPISAAHQERDSYGINKS